MMLLLCRQTLEEHTGNNKSKEISPIYFAILFNNKCNAPAANWIHLKQGFQVFQIMQLVLIGHLFFPDWSIFCSPSIATEVSGLNTKSHKQSSKSIRWLFCLSLTLQLPVLIKKKTFLKTWHASLHKRGGESEEIREVTLREEKQHQGESSFI